MRTNIEMCETVKINNIPDDRGSLCFVESGKDINFKIKRIYYIYGVPKDSKRGSHAHKNLHQLFIPISGKFDLKINDGDKEKIINMKSPSIGIYIPPMIWREVENFSRTAVCLVLASEFYSLDDYIYNFDYFKELKNEGN